MGLEFDEVLKILEQRSIFESLTNTQIVVLKGAWEGKKYPEIADSLNYDSDYVKAIGAKLWQILTDKLKVKVTKINLRHQLENYYQNTIKRSYIIKTNHQDWGKAVDISIFYGREKELNQLQQWILKDNCRLIGILGIGGVGKTVLGIRLAKQIQGQFDYVIWRCLRNAPPFDFLLTDLINVTGKNLISETSLTNLLQLLKDNRCLIILDNLESILNANSQGKYLQDYEKYEELFNLIGAIDHDSCLILTSREKPSGIFQVNSSNPQVKILSLQSSIEISKPLLESKNLVATDEQIEMLSLKYDRNPLALNLVTNSIQDLFLGNVKTFLECDTTIFNGVKDLLAQQFDRLNKLEKTIVFWLAINREWTSIEQLAEDIYPPVNKADIIHGLTSLVNRNLVEQKAGIFSQKSLIMEYVTTKLVEQVSQEILFSEDNYFETINSYCLIKTNVKSYIKNTQINYILKSIVIAIKKRLITPPKIKDSFLFILQIIKEKSLLGYGVGNLINLSQQLQLDLIEFDFSGLTIWQADLQGVDLQRVNFNNCHFFHTLFTQSLGLVLALEFNHQGNYLALADHKGEIHIYAFKDLEQPVLVCQAHHGRILDLSWHHNDLVLASCGIDRTVKLWNTQTGELLNTFTAHQNLINTIAWSQDKSLIATGDDDGLVYLWDWQTGEIKQSFNHDGDGVRAICFDGINLHLISGDDRGIVKIWEPNTGKNIKTIQAHSAGIWDIAFHPDQSIFATTGEDKLVVIWDSINGEKLQILQSHSYWVSSLSWHKDGEYLLSGSMDSTVKLWQWETAKLIKTFAHDRGTIWTVAWYPHDFIIVSGGSYPAVVFWLGNTGNMLNNIQGYTNAMRCVSWQPNHPQNLLASCGDDGIIRIWDHQKEQIKQRFHGHQGRIWSFTWDKTGQFLISAGDDYLILLWDINQNKPIKTFKGHHGRIWSIAWCENNSYFISGSGDRSVKLWDSITGRLIKTFSGHTRQVICVAAHPSQPLIASGSEDCTLRLWHQETGEMLHCLNVHHKRLYTLNFSPDGQYLASAGLEGVIIIWEVKTVKAIHVLKGHQNLISSLEFSPDSRYLASAGMDNQICIWDFKTEKIINKLVTDCGVIWSISWHSRDFVLASGSDDETLRIWDLETGECVQILTSQREKNTQHDRPYEGMQIDRISGLNQKQINNLMILGAVTNNL